MSETGHNYHAEAADWRKAIRINQSRTRFVIVSFVLLYVALGLLFDMYLYSNSSPQVPLQNIFIAIMTLKVLPLCTLVTTGIALIALWVTFTFHDKLMLLGTEYHEVTPQTANALAEKQLYNTVEEMKIAAGLGFMPRVFIIEADYMNAFASGYSEQSAMVAITRGLLEKLDRAETQAVMAHELSHIRHMDIKLTLMASVLANIMLIMIDLIFWNFRSSNNRNGGGLVVAIVIIRILLPILTMVLMLYLSRLREYMADAGCVELMRNNEPLARALIKIEQDYLSNAESYTQTLKQTAHESVRRQAYIYDPSKANIAHFSSVTDLFSSHPNTKKRLEAIGYKPKNQNP